MPEPEPPAITAETALQPVPLERLPMLLDDGDWQGLDRAIRRSVGWLKGRPAGTTLTFGRREVAATALVAHASGRIESSALPPVA